MGRNIARGVAVVAIVAEIAAVARAVNKGNREKSAVRRTVAEKQSLGTGLLFFILR